jgi:hypothetical protein
VGEGLEASFVFALTRLALGSITLWVDVKQCKHCASLTTEELI